MGLSSTKIYFQEGIPTIAVIREQFRKQTGYDLCVNASLNLSRLGNLIEVSQVLNRDFENVLSVQKERTALTQSHPTDYEKRAKVRDKLVSLNHIRSLSFGTWLYDIDFEVDGNYLVVKSEIGQVYAIESLVKVLIELGGSFESAESLDLWQKRWKKLKPWNEYRWYNRPGK